MSNFIMIAPEGWVALDTEYYENNTPLTKGMFDAGWATVIEVAIRVTAIDCKYKAELQALGITVKVV